MIHKRKAQGMQVHPSSSLILGTSSKLISSQGFEQCGNDNVVVKPKKHLCILLTNTKSHSSMKTSFTSMEIHSYKRIIAITCKLANFNRI